ncbi:hypothetical protein G9A89_015600 [Geosiphon pyriformis]|nr:hypothetical protein G9A89_015600 [Geosiphon pyriformis]
MHPVDLQAAITNARNFEAAELEANHAHTTKINTTELEIIDGSLSTNLHQNPNAQHYLNLLVTPKDASPNNTATNQKQLITSNIPPATVTNDKSLAAIFLFELEETTPVLLFSGAILDTKLITAMYIDVKVDGHAIKQILNSGSTDSIITKQLMDQLGYQVDCAANTRIITTDEATKTPIGEIDNFPIEVNSITIPIKVLVMEAT